MPKFSKTSRSRLNECHPHLQLLFDRVVEGWDCSILTGHRTEAAQNQMAQEGKSKVKWPLGRHNARPSLAVDACPYPIPDWNDRKHFDAFAGYVIGVAAMVGIGIRWGGDWNSDKNLNDQTFNDLVHFELTDKPADKPTAR